MRLHCPVAILLCSAIAAPLLADPPVKNDPSPIVVQGERDRDRQIEQFIKNLTPSPIRGQLARFEVPVCPKVDGAAAGQAAIMEARIRKVATEAGIDVAKPGCIPNMTVIITPDKLALLQQIYRRPGAFPDDWSEGTIQKLIRSPSPVAAWKIEQDVWLDGGSVRGRDRDTPHAEDVGAITGPNVPHIMPSNHAVATRLQPSARPAFAHSMLVIDSSALNGLTLTQVADYCAMRSLLGGDPESLGASGPESILKIIGSPAGSLLPASVTAWDMAFLKSFYSSTSSRYAEYQRAQMKGEMKRQLDALQPVGREP